MGNNDINVSTQVLHDTAKHVRDINKDLDEKLRTIYKTVDALEESYNSDSGKKIRDAMRSLNSTFDRYRDKVESYAAFLVTAAQSHESTEASNESNASQVESNSSKFKK